MTLWSRLLKFDTVNVNFVLSIVSFVKNLMCPINCLWKHYITNATLLCQHLMLMDHLPCGYEPLYSAFICLWNKSVVLGAMDPCSSEGLCLYKSCEVPRPPCSYPHHTVVLLPLMINVSNVGLCRYEGHMVFQRYCCSKVPTSISQTLVLFNVSTALRSLLIASSNPPCM